MDIYHDNCIDLIMSNRGFYETQYTLHNRQQKRLININEVFKNDFQKDEVWDELFY